MSQKYILAVPNFSEGRKKEVIEKIVDEVRNVEGVKLVSYEPEHDFNRTVVTLIGEPEPLMNALIDMAGKSYELINMEELAVKLYDRCEVPIYFSGVNARCEERKALSFIRKGQYEGLKEVAHTEERKPDIGPAALHNTAGATIVSADLEGLTAYNVFLDTENLEIAKKIAKAVRGPSGGFSTVRSVGIKFPEREGVVVSMNMFDCGQTPLYRTYNFVKQEAARYGIAVTGSEIVGPVKLDYLLNSLEYLLGLENFRKEQILEAHLMK